MAVYLLPKVHGGLVFTDDSGDPIQLHHEAALGQREVRQLRFHLSETEKGLPQLFSANRTAGGSYFSSSPPFEALE